MECGEWRDLARALREREGGIRLGTGSDSAASAGLPRSRHQLEAPLATRPDRPRSRFDPNRPIGEIWHSLRIDVSRKRLHRPSRGGADPAVLVTSGRVSRAPGVTPSNVGPKHHRRDSAGGHREVSAAIERVRASDPAKVDTLAFEFLVLTVARGGVERDRPRGGRVAGSRQPDEDRVRAPCAAMWPGVVDPRCGAEVGRRREPDRVRHRAREVAGRRAADPTPQEAPDCGRAAWVPVELSGTGRPRRRTIPGRSSRLRSRMSSGTRSRRLYDSTKSHSTT